MKHNRCFITCVALMLGLPWAGCSHTWRGHPVAVTTSRSPHHTIQLFNGTNLDGFYTYLRDRGRDVDPRNVFSIENGMIRISGEEWGCLITNEAYGNYRLVAEYKWGEPTWPPREHAARDSGIILHSVGRDAAHSGTWMYGIEVLIIEGGTGGFIVVGDGTARFALTSPVHGPDTERPRTYKPGGSLLALTGRGKINWSGRDPAWKDVKGFRGKHDVENPVGQWNRIECTARGREITVSLNGVVVSRGFGVRPSRGRIQIQSEGAVIFFRRIDLTPLNEADADARAERGPGKGLREMASLSLPGQNPAPPETDE